MEDLFQLTLKAIIKNHVNKVLLLKVPKHKTNIGLKSSWDLPGGRIQRHQTIEESFLREIFEETGITAIGNIQHILTLHTPVRLTVDDNNFGLMVSLYSCHLTTQESQLILSDEHEDHCWVDAHEAAELLNFFPPLVREAIKKV
jgi:8-oxo-dGTP pyrophosphatase MutT (NUDIX family)